MGGLVGQPQLAARPAAVRARSRTATSPPYGKRTPSDAAAIERFEELAAEAPGSIEVERSKLGAARRVEPSLAEPPTARPRRVRPDARPALAADVLHRHHRRRLRGRGRQRARGDAGRRRADAEPRPRRGRAGSARRRAVAAGGDARRRRGRDARAPRAGGDRLRGGRPRRRAGRADRRRAGAAGGRSRRARRRRRGPARRDRDAARPAARRRCGCATSRAPIASTSSSSSCRSWAATSRPGALTLRSDRTCPARAPARRRSARRVRGPARRRGAAAERSRLPDRQPRPGAPAAARRRAAVRGDRLQDQLARRSRASR